VPRVPARIDPDVLDRAIGAWLAVQQPPANPPSSRAVLAQTDVAATINEITGFQPLLEGLDLTGRVVTAGAMPTQHAHADWLVTHRRAAYVLGDPPPASHHRHWPGIPPRHPGGPDHPDESSR